MVLGSSESGIHVTRSGDVERNADGVTETLRRIRLLQRHSPACSERARERRRALPVELGYDEIDRTVKVLGNPHRIGGSGGRDYAIAGIREDFEEHVTHGRVALDNDDRLPRAGGCLPA